MSETTATFHNIPDSKLKRFSKIFIENSCKWHLEGYQNPKAQYLSTDPWVSNDVLVQLLPLPRRLARGNSHCHSTLPSAANLWQNARSQCLQRQSKLGRLSVVCQLALCFIHPGLCKSGIQLEAQYNDL